MNPHIAATFAMVPISLLAAAAASAPRPALAAEPPAATGENAAAGDVAPGSPVYQAMESLAKDGLVLGYKDAGFLNGRTLTRYEVASLVKRVVDNLAQKQRQAKTLKRNGAIARSTPRTATPPQTVPAGPNQKIVAPTAATPVATRDQVKQVAFLVDAVKPELAVIGTNLQQAQDTLQELRDQIAQLDQQVIDLQQNVNDARELAVGAQDTADNSYGFGSGRKFAITGYVQARYQYAENGDQARFPNGAPANVGASNYNGNYAQGGSRQTFVNRRSRLKLTGRVTPNANYGIQIDAAGAFSGGPTGNQQVTVREGYVNYTFGDGSTNYPTLTFGQWANFYGYQLPLSSSQILTPERPLAFNEGSTGLFPSSDYERGLALNYVRAPFRYAVALVNGTGLASNDVDRALDQIYRVSYSGPTGTGTAGIGVGLSYYHGHLPGSGVGLGNPNATPPVAAYSSGRKELLGVDFQYISPNPVGGPFVLAEYTTGKFERRTFFSTPAATSATTTNPAPGNKVEGYYVQAGYTFGADRPNPLTIGLSYDVFRRSKSGLADSGSSFDDINFGYGLLYNLDRQTRLRLWYIDPARVSHLPTVDSPPKLGLFTGEVQVRF